MRYWFLIVLCLYTSSSLGLVKVDTLYESSILASSQSADERQSLIKQGMADVLTKVSGIDKLYDLNDLQPYLNNSQRYIQEYSYSYSHSSPSRPFLFKMYFDPKGINHVLHKVSLPNWGVERPLTLIWVTETVSGQKQQIVNEENASTLTFLLRKNFDKRGLPIVFPLVDMQDLAIIGNDNFANPDIDNLLKLAKRYHSDSLLIGSIDHSPNGLHTRWEFLTTDSEASWDIPSQSIADALATVSDNVIDMLAKNYGVKTSQQFQTEFMVQVMHINANDDLEDLIHYLKQLSSVKKVITNQVFADKVILSITANKEQFLKLLAEDNYLKLVSADLNGDLLTYEWNQS